MKYTPEQIVNEELYFSIPIYQRLFEWNADNINMLLSDLKREYDNEKNDYYIGMLTTVFSSGRYDLVDGQQRFIVIMLIGCVMRRYDERWNNFINKDIKYSTTHKQYSQERQTLKKIKRTTYIKHKIVFQSEF